MQQSPQLPKVFLNKYYNYSSHDLQTLYGLLQYDLDSFVSFLEHAKPSAIELTFHQLHHRPQLLGQITQFIHEGQYVHLRRFLKGKPINDDQQDIGQLEQVEEAKKEIQQNAPIFHIHYDIIIKIIDFLDPMSLIKFFSTCREFHSQLKPRCDLLYRKFVTILFDRKMNRIPTLSPYQAIIDSINNNLHLYQNDVVEQVNSNVRDLIWSKVSYDRLITADSPFEDLQKKYAKYEHFFLKAPRIHFCGVYAIQEKYIKFGEADLHHSTAPCYLVDYFRYLRFWPDGLATMFISNKKLKRQDILSYFLDKSHPKLIFGEYLIDEDKLWVKTSKGTTVFTYKYQIKSSKKAPSDVLQILNVSMKMIDSDYVNNLSTQSQSKFMFYKHIKEFRELLPPENGLEEVTF